MTISLICLPYAGSSAQVYKRWANRLHPDVRLVRLNWRAEEAA